MNLTPIWLIHSGQNPLPVGISDLSDGDMRDCSTEYPVKLVGLYRPMSISCAEFGPKRRKVYCFYTTSAIGPAVSQQPLRILGGYLRRYMCEIPLLSVRINSGNSG